MSNTVSLSERMQAVASMVTEGNVLADIGTDHAYLPIALVQQQRIPGAIAMDINNGPLARAKANISEYGMDSYIQTRLSDGVKELAREEADTIMIAGMGGELMIRILSEGADICRSAKELVLQPQSDLRKVRTYLRENGYRIADEDMVCEEEKFYTVMRVIPEEQGAFSAKPDERTVTCDIYGPVLLKKNHPVLRRYLMRQQQNLTELILALKKQKMTCAIEKRMLELREELFYNESAYHILGDDKHAGI